MGADVLMHENKLQGTILKTIGPNIRAFWYT